MAEIQIVTQGELWDKERAALAGSAEASETSLVTLLSLLHGGVEVVGVTVVDHPHSLTILSKTRP